MLYYSWQTKIKRIASLKNRIEQGGGLDAIKKQHSAGKLTARERLSKFFDENSFVEIDSFVKSRIGLSKVDAEDSWGDGVVAGYGSVNGRLVYAVAQDYSFATGAVGEMHAKKIVKIIDMAIKNGAPFINILDSNGARIQEGLDALSGYGEIFHKTVEASGLIPQISVIMGPCASWFFHSCNERFCVYG